MILQHGLMILLFNSVHTGVKTEGICVKDLKMVFQRSTYFSRLPAREQRKSVTKRLVDEINAVNQLKQKFRKRKMINNVNFVNVIVEYEFKSDELKALYSLKTQIFKPYES